MSQEMQIQSPVDLDKIITEIEMSSLGPTNWNWCFAYKPISADNRAGFLLWVEFDRIDYDTSLPGRGRSRDMILWEGTYKSGVIKTYWVLVQSVVTHELMHAFRYRGRELFDPHAGVDLLHSIAGQAKVDAYNRFAASPQGKQV